MENDGLARFPRITMNMQIIQSGSGSMTSRGETRPENSWVKGTGGASVIMNAHHQLNLRTKVALWGISWVCMTTLNSLTLWPIMDGVSQIWVIRTHWKSDHVAEKCIFPQKSGRQLSHWKSPNVWTCVELALLGSNSPMEVLSAVFTYILFSSIFFLVWIKN